jgi:cytoskeleton protein RodZ
MAENGAAVLHDRGSRLGSSHKMTRSAEPVVELPAEAPNAGADLRSARERLGVTLPEAAEALRIRVAYLAALEDGRLSALPATAYALGFLRSYATALGLDAEEMIRRFRAETAEVGRKTELAFPAPVPERGLPAGAIMLLGVVLLGVVYAGWYRLSGEGRLPAEAVAPIPERLAPLAEQAIPPVLVARPVPRIEAATPPPLLAGEPVVPPPSISPSSAAAAPVNPLAVNPLPAKPGPVAEPPPDQTRVVIRATADAWIQVRERGGAILLNKVLKPGESWPVPHGRAGLTFTTGNAGGTEVVLDGAVVPGLGGAGAVRRDLPLDPDLLKDGRLSPQPVAAPGRTQQ